jgi:hypothetical protein
LAEGYIIRGLIEGSIKGLIEGSLKMTIRAVIDGWRVYYYYYKAGLFIDIFIRGYYYYYKIGRVFKLSFYRGGCYRVCLILACSFK